MLVAQTFALGLAALLPQASTATEGVAVEYLSPTVTLRVSAPSDLRMVLEALCERVEAECLLTASMKQVRVSPGVRSGTWGEVVSSLLEGSGLGYATTPPTAGRRAHLLVERERAVAANDGARPAAPTARLPEDARNEPAPTLDAELQTPAEPEPPATDGTEPDPSAVEAAAGPGGLVTIDAVASGAVAAESVVMTPFSDGDGKPLLTRVAPKDGMSGPGGGPPGMALLPYSDSDGQPMLVPVTNEPLVLTPFAGPDGEPWPAPAPVPNQKLEYPVPANVRPAKKPEAN